MPTFSSKSLLQLETCHPDLKILFNSIIKMRDCTVLQGFRNEADQNAAFAAGNSKLKWPHGKHNKNPSLAVDVAPYPIDWDDSSRFYHFSGFVLGVAEMLLQSGKMSHEIRWGGDWDGDSNLMEEKLKDLVHYEIIM